MLGPECGSPLSKPVLSLLSLKGRFSGTFLCFPRTRLVGELSCRMQLDYAPISQEFLKDRNREKLSLPADIAMVVPATIPIATPLVLGAATGAG